MKKQHLLTLLLLTVTAVTNAQSFRERLINRPIALPIASQMGDVDGDGDNDIVTASRQGELVWHEQQPDSTYVVHYIETFAGPMQELNNLAIVDLDEDGNMDVITNSAIPNSGLSWYRNDGTENFTAITIPSTVTNDDDAIIVKDIDNDGDYDIIADQSNKILILENDGSENFTETTITGPGQIANFHIEDFDDDNLLDIAIAGSTGLSIFIQGTGLTFSENSVQALNHNDLVVGDLDGDDDLDIVATFTAGGLRFYYNQGDNITFSETISSTNAKYLNLSDMDEDGDLDLVYYQIPPSDSQYRFSILRNDSTPDFNQANPIEIVRTNNRPGGAIRELVVDDFDFDNKPDVLATYEPNGAVELYRNMNIHAPQEEMDFLRRVVSQSSGDVQDISVADMNGDGFLDVVASEKLDYDLDWFENSGNNSDFTIKPVAFSPDAVANEAIDLDGDGDIDVVACQGADDNNDHWFLWWENDGAGNFSRRNIYALNNGGAITKDVKVADLDNDGDIDVVGVGYPKTRVFYNDGNENFSVFEIPVINTSTETVAIDDMNNDGLKDIVVWYNGAMNWCQNLNGTFSGPIELSLNSGTLPAASRAIEIADMDSDNDLDIVYLAASNFAPVCYMENIGGLSFNVTSFYDQTTLSGTANDLKLADIDDDGFVDIIVASAQKSIVLMSNDGGTFTFNPLLDFDEAAYANLSSVQVVDFDTDGDLDIVYSGTTGDRIAWLEQCAATTSTDVVSACETYTWMDGNTYTESNNTATWVIDNAAGCDSIISLDLTISSPEPTLQESVFVCDGESYTFPDGSIQTITSQVVYLSTLQSVITTCDSVIETTVNLNPIYDLAETAIVCSGEGYTFPDGTTQSNITAQVVHVSSLQATTTQCDSTITTTVNVTAVEVGVTQSGGTLQADAVGTSYQWLDCDNGDAPIAPETNSVFMPTATGNYAVEVTENGCTDTSSCYVVLITDVAPLEQAEIAVYPNPTNGQFTITSANANYSIEIYNNMGQLLQRQNALQATTAFDLQQQAAGIYYVHVITNNEVSRFKLIKQ